MTESEDTSWCDPSRTPDLDYDTKLGWLALADLLFSDDLWERYYLRRKNHTHLCAVRRKLLAKKIAAREALKNLTPEEKKERQHEQRKAASRKWWKLHGREYMQKKRRNIK